MAQHMAVKDIQRIEKGIAVVVVCSAYVRKHATQVIEWEGVGVVAFGYLDKAIEYLQRHNALLVVLDLDCCGGKNRETIHKISAISAATKIAFFVGWWEKGESGIEEEHVCYLSRPIRPDEVHELLTQVRSAAQKSNFIYN